MTSTAQALGVDPTGPAHQQEALLLVELLRSTRLSLLYAEAGSDKTALLRFGLVPLLCRRAGDRLDQAAFRPSGVVVPFPDRRSRSSGVSSKRRREIVVYFGEWTDAPLAALRESLYKSVAAGSAEGREPAPRLSAVLAELSQRFDAHFIILLDRFEDLLQTSSDQAAIDEFVNELAEAINQAQLPANFLISLAEEAKPGLASLRSRIRSFDDSSLKLAPTRAFTQPAATVRHQKPAAPAEIETLPLLSVPLKVPSTGSTPAQTAALGSTKRTAANQKIKESRPPRVQVKTEDVYEMIAAALSTVALRSAAGAVSNPGRLVDSEPLNPYPQAPAQRPTAAGGLKKPMTHVEPIGSGLPPSGLLDFGASRRGKILETAIDRMERRLSVGAKDRQES